MCCFFSSTAFTQTDKLRESRQSIKEHIAEHDFTGAAVAYIASDGQLSYILESARRKGGATIDKQTIFEIGSVTKIFTALALADFISSHKDITLDSKAEPLLPESYQLPEYQGQSVTLRHLVTHTSGLPKIPSNLPASSPNPYSTYGDSLFEAYLNNDSLSRAPGDGFQYSNSGMALVGRVLEHQLQQPFEQIIQKSITQPLQMKDTFVQVTDKDSSRLAKGYRGNGRANYWNFDVFAGAGALHSTIADMAIFLKAQMQNKSTEINSLANRTQQPLSDIQNKESRLDKVGMGWLYSTRKDTIIWHNGQTGGFRSFIGMNIENNTGVVMLVNSTAPISDIALHLLDSNFKLKKVQQSVSIPSSLLQKYTGEYRVTNRISYFVSLHKNQLYFRVSGQQKIPFFPKSKTRFYYKTVPAEIEFSADSAGAVQDVTLFQNGREIKAKKVD